MSMENCMQVFTNISFRLRFYSSEGEKKGWKNITELHVFVVIFSNNNNHENHLN